MIRNCWFKINEKVIISIHDDTCQKGFTASFNNQSLQHFQEDDRYDIMIQLRQKLGEEKIDVRIIFATLLI